MLLQHQLYANKKKCSFWTAESGVFMAHYSRHMVAKDRSKIQAMVDWLSPNSLQELRVGMSNRLSG